MLPSYVRALASGHEHGEYLALDLGGTNFRVLLVRFNAHQFNVTNKTYTIPKQFMTGTGEQVKNILNIVKYFFVKFFKKS